MLGLNKETTVARRGKLRVCLASGESEILEAQKLRWRVFADELGARLPSRIPGVDQDIYDRFCEHLIVRDEEAGRIVGTYRILSPAAAQRIGAYYSDSEFDLTRFHHLRDGIVEIGRSCVDPDYRSGAVIALLWQGLAAYMAQHRYRYLMGCASIGMADGGYTAAAIYRGLEPHLAPLQYRVFPRHRLPLERLESSLEPALPPLLKGYLRAGAVVCGEPAWDPDFNTADLLVFLRMDELDPRYARHFSSEPRPAGADNATVLNRIIETTRRVFQLGIPGNEPIPA